MDQSESKKTKPRRRLFGWRDTKDNTTEEEIMEMVAEGHQRGELLESEAEMIQNIFELDEKDARDVMIHRKNISALDGHMTLREALSFIAQESFSRYPVYLNDTDDIIGVVHIKDLLAFCLRPDQMDTQLIRLHGVVRQAVFVPETQGIHVLFQRMRKSKVHLVVVVDEYGQTAGIVTMEDILEEIVGNILDEHDEEETTIISERDGSFLIDGETPIEEVCDTLGIEEDAFEDVDTLNGYIIAQIDQIPEEGQTYSVHGHGYRFDVLCVENRMVKTVRAVREETGKTGAEGRDMV